ncbi:NB-ARC domain-containing protein [Streptomyces malaysiensis]|uniref:NB-ARC domain-containing protein n=1 Tax=Streptomyces malaysiensis subsp. samsunensis TaxID=459658 RepID=A0A9X2LSU1_STRMQ|nr:NB-ARC domain-containing protein [Streptomyces samsunensis]MCQ8828786.1 NB-ARC domain-containing protein [Streptomyces samsunensis]
MGGDTPKTITVHAAHGGVAIGGADQVNYYASAREPATWPHQVGVIPSRAQSFQHRAEAERLRAAADDGGTAVRGQILTGMGGVGKTQLAADHARTAWQDGNLDVLVWVAASTRPAVVAGYAQAGVELCVADPGDPERAARTFLAWLAPKAGARPCRWLIVLDDVADPGDLRGLWPPAGPYGRTLVTTRRRDAALTGEERHRIEVGLFTEAEAVAYLTTSLAAHGRHEPEGGLTALAADLGHLPLALSQAVAYLIDSGEDVATHRSQLSDRATPLADTTPDQLPDEQARPLAAAWSLSVDRADSLRPSGLARPMLRLAALLDPNGIPQTVLTSEPVLGHLLEHRTRQAPTGESEPVSPRDAVRVLRVLHRLSLIDHTPATPHQAVRIHQLIQRATRDSLAPERHDRLARTAADALTAVWPDIERDTSSARALRANTRALISHAEKALFGMDGVHPLLTRLGRSLGAAGQAAAAAAHFRHLAATALDRLGSDHPHTLAARRDHARWRGMAGDTDGAAATLAELLPDDLRVLGPDHIDTLMTRHNIAVWRGTAGDAAGAATALAARLPDFLRTLGPDHPRTLGVRHNLAHWRGEAGDATGAAAAFTGLLPDYVRVLGPYDSRTLITRAQLAHWRGMAGDPAGAATAFGELLPDDVRVLGPDHVSTLIARYGLAHWRGEAGDPAGATAALAALLPDFLRVLGPNHPRTLTTGSQLAHWTRQARNGTVRPSTDP